MDKLITFLGTGDYQETIFYMGDREVQTEYANVALAQLFRPASVVVMVTDEAREKHLAKLKARIAELDPDIKVVDISIPLGVTEEELWTIFSRMSEQVQPGERVGIDITHSFRSIPLIAVMSAAYLKWVRQIRLDHLFYGYYVSKRERNPLLDLSQLLSLLDWMSGAHLFLQAGNVSQLADKLRRIQQENKNHLEKPRLFQDFANQLDEITLALSTAQIQRLMAHAQALAEYKSSPTGRQLESEIARWAQPFKFLLPFILEQYATFTKADTEQDIDRFIDKVMELVKWYKNHGYYPQAATLMREIMITKLLAAKGKTDVIFKEREREKHIGELYLKIDHPVIKLWQHVTDIRNRMAHPSTRHYSSESRAARLIKSIDKCYATLKAYLDDDELWMIQKNIEHTDNKVVLISPLGMSPGLLYAAIRRVEPDHVIVITSTQVRQKLPEILEQAAYPEEQVTIYETDPFYGYQQAKEIAQRVKNQVDREIPGYPHVYVNMTGGSTALQYIVQQIERDIQRCACQVTQVAFVDRRSPAEQQENPYVPGEMLTLEPGND